MIKFLLTIKETDCKGKVYHVNTHKNLGVALLMIQAYDGSIRITHNIWLN